MAENRDLREIRHWLNETRGRLLDAFLAVNDAVKRNEADARDRLVAKLRATDEFRNTSHHEEHQPT